MKKETKKFFCIGAALLLAFGVWSVLLRFVDVRAIGPDASKVGLASLNSFVHKLTGANMSLYVVTDWLGLVPVFVAIGFGVLGLTQWIKRKSLRQVDYSLFVLGGFYAAVLAAFVFFEYVVVNYRPVLVEGVLEVSYPSSTTLLVLCVMPTAAMELGRRIKNMHLRRCVAVAIAVFTVFMVTARLLSGVHWISDIIGGVLLSAGLVILYHAVCSLKEKK